MNFKVTKVNWNLPDMKLSLFSCCCKMHVKTWTNLDAIYVSFMNIR